MQQVYQYEKNSCYAIFNFATKNRKTVVYPNVHFLTSSIIK